MPTKAVIISIGDEILYGQTLDTNAHWISGELNKAGIQVEKRYTIGDRREEILSTLKEAEERAKIILITGGLGPTSDDLTKPCLLEYFDTYLVRNESVLNHIIELFTTRGREVTEVNKAQADIPANGKAVPNILGTAPGVWIEENGKVFVSMPGVPYEMQQMMTDTVIPQLREKYVKGELLHRMIRTIGIPESALANMIREWETNLPKAIKLAYLPTKGSVKLRLTAKREDEDHFQTQKLIQEEINKVLPTIEKYVYGFDDEEIEEAIGRMLLESKMSLSTAESCTGGYLSHKITSVPGSSQWYEGGFIPYSNKFKNEQLRVPLEMLEEHGAVSKPVVLVLAENVRKAFNTSIGVSISGIAGPTGGTEEKPVGTVWIGYSDQRKTVAKKFLFTKDRLINIHYTAMAALDMIRINLTKD
ncbi:MAG: competence/damage-inducible protein A [Ekhidna sp.]|nr:competence/damage-inducible protein A [Ekhidna sp.]MBC6425893.1 competence/damage-inducible protein A [Ekhidna sp.]